jgi:hypothetical protein
LRLLFGSLRLRVFGEKSPARSNENDEERGEKSHHKLEGRVSDRGRM